MFNRSALKKIPAIELGLSADTEIADHLKELSEYTFLTNSDAHSLPKIGREYNIIELEKANFKEIFLALQRKEGRKITANYGLDSHRPPYYHQVPLEFVPGVGKKTLNKLFDYFGTEMNILHKASYQEISQVVGFEIAQNIILARKGLLELSSGGGGKYGKVKKKEKISGDKNLQLNF
jgi:PHP family Zn ribbon phosphoesterase